MASSHVVSLYPGLQSPTLPEAHAQHVHVSLQLTHGALGRQTPWCLWPAGGTLVYVYCIACACTSSCGGHNDRLGLCLLASIEACTSQHEQPAETLTPQGMALACVSQYPPQLC